VTNTRSFSAGPVALHLKWFGVLAGLAVFVGAEEGDVEVHPRVLKVVDVAAEAGDLLLRGEHKADVGVLLVPVQVVQPAVVQRDHVGPQPGLVERLLFELPHDGSAGGERVGRGHARLHRGVHLGRHVRDLLEDVDLLVRALQLLVARLA
jgi:hypothetical protein